ncbi:DUF3300 domain-containing protein [Edaphobacter aggregans]|uniref:DUF3300 domain-containing protein n=1 Tax=Edaphobacter aggregans TaxID=570835 RepID=UPI0005567965|nr:DUF3300 domain-containing protein [Edaphobacter aggregans]
MIHAIREFTALVCVVLLVPGNAVAVQAQQPAAPTQQPAAPAEQPPVKLPPEQLDSLVAPIALYPDPLLSQTLVASTYPLEIVQLQQWLDQHKDLKDKALADAVQKQDWDPSIQAMAALPDVVKQLSENIKWTADLGNAFLAQQSDVMDAVQRMRKKANEAGNLKSSEQQNVETKVVENKQVIVIEQANPQVVYVPTYNPTVVYGPPVYPYPPIAYPPPGYYAAGMAISFGVGIAMGAAWGGGWGYGCGWGGNNDININRNNTFVNNSNRQNINNANRGNRPSTQPARGSSNWQHNPQHRGGAPYSDRATANKYGGSTRGDSAGTRQASARQNAGTQPRQQPAAGGRDMSAGGRDVSSRPAGGGASAGTMDANRGGGGGADRVGNRQVSQSPSATNRSAFGGASGGMSGSQARASSSRGASSMGGGSRGGGGGRSGGGRRR